MRISDTYLKQQKSLHENPAYGVASIEKAPLVASIMKQTNSKTISDYGAGKKALLDSLIKLGITPEKYFPYDPVFSDYGPPTEADLVCCIDVLEHIEIECLDEVLDDILLITKRFAFFSISYRLAMKVLEDGRNAHLIVAPPSWWLAKIIQRFEVHRLQNKGNGFWMVLSKKDREPIFNFKGSREDFTSK